MNYFEDQLDQWLTSRRRLLPLARFNDNDIRPMDEPTWRGVEQLHTRFGQNEKHLEMLMDRIELEGLKRPVEIWANENGELPVVYNGHHRITVFRHLGWTHIPYRWFSSHPTTRVHTYYRKPLP